MNDRSVGSTGASEGWRRWNLAEARGAARRAKADSEEITPANASRLLPQWTMQTGVLGKFEATPIVIDGKNLFQYRVGSPVYASPTTYAIDGRQYVVLPAGTTLTAFWCHKKALRALIR